MKPLVTGSLATAALRNILNSQAKNSKPTDQGAQLTHVLQAASFGESVPLDDAPSSSAAA